MDIFQIFGRIAVENDDAVSALKDTSKQAEKTSDSFSDIDKSSQDAGKTTKKTGKDMIASFLKVSAVAGTVVTAVIAIGKAMIELADSTREYRTEMTKLETAFDMAGHSADVATDTYRTLYSVLGETDQAVEAANHLARLCDTEEQLAQMTKACVGAFATWGDSLPLEGLTEAANETAKVGTVTGQLADALNWAGVAEDDFNVKLSACNSERERAQLITETLIELYGEAADTYLENSDAIVDAYLAQEVLNEAMARFGELCEPVAASWRTSMAAIINVLADLIEGIDITEGAINDRFAAKGYSSVDEITERISALRTELENLNNVPYLARADNHDARVTAICAEIASLELAYEGLAAAEQGAAEAMSDATDADRIAQFTSATEQYVQDATAIYTKFAETYENVYNRVSGWFGLFDQASTSVKTSVDEMMAAMQSQIDFNNSYSANLQALKDYGLGSLSEAFQSYGAEGAAYADAIVRAVEEAGGATTEEGQAIIQGFAEMNEQVTKSQSELSQTVTLMNGELEAELQDVRDTYAASIEDLDMATEASEAARSTFRAFLESVNQEIPRIMTAVSGFGSQLTQTIQSGIGTINIPFTLTGNGYIPKAKTGLDYVPYDEYLVYLHKGEAVLTAEEASAWRAGRDYAASESGQETGTGTSGVTIIQNITAVAQTPVELASATAAYFEQARWTL